jgi:hypothetical protein
MKLLTHNKTPCWSVYGLVDPRYALSDAVDLKPDAQ